MNSGINIVDYTPGDYPALAEMWNELGLGGAHRGDNEAVIEKCNTLGGFLILLKNDDSAIIGSSWITTDGRRCYLHHFGISEKFQGQGLAKLLMNESMERIRGLGMQAKLEVHRDNVKALSLYKRYGYQYLGDYDVYIIRNI